MDDLISLAVIVAVTAALMGYVRFCHRIAGGPDDAAPVSVTSPSDGTDSTPSRSVSEGR